MQGQGLLVHVLGRDELQIRLCSFKLRGATANLRGTQFHRVARRLLWWPRLVCRIHRIYLQIHRPASTSINLSLPLRAARGSFAKPSTGRSITRRIHQRSSCGPLSLTASILLISPPLRPQVSHHFGPGGHAQLRTKERPGWTDVFVFARCRSGRVLGCWRKRPDEIEAIDGTCDPQNRRMESPNGRA